QKPPKCKICNVEFKTIINYLCRLHMTQKHGDKQHTCSECEKSFTYFQQLRVHMAHHARKSIFACQDCDMEFNRNSDLRAHQQQEHLESYEKAPENCPECEFRCFSRFLSLSNFFLSIIF
ncbi:hypothetical protein HELRODRAFT_73882, partial [Helobdella robusta]|uniref:C2H2-type domain-containing protein n=1 Tax=Helobdella robusta TaxID=6412 RepID=T1G1J9_HELRO